MTRTRPAHPQTNAYGLLFHPDLIRGTHLGRHIGEYSFFSYEINEALHLSDSEREIFINYLNIIQGELKHAVDKHSKNLLSMHIEVLLGYCMRFTNGNLPRAPWPTQTPSPVSKACLTTTSSGNKPSTTACPL